MHAAFRAGDEPAPTRLDHWQHAIGEIFGPLDARIPGGLDTGARLRAADAGAVRVVELSHRELHVVERAQKHIRQFDPEVYKIDVQARGTGVIEQDGRQAEQTPGDITFVDLSRPCRWVYRSVDLVAVVFPRTLMPLRQDDLARLTGVRIPGDRGVGALVSSLARQIPAHLDEGSPADRVRLGTAVLDLVIAALATRLGRAQLIPPDSRQRALLQRVLAFVEEQLGDPDLSPTSIAKAHHISMRYLYKVFEAEQATPADWIRRRRLERCRRDLLDPALYATPVGRIAQCWGFTSAAQFSRAFRAAYGLSPSEYRVTSHHTAASK